MEDLCMFRASMAQQKVRFHAVATVPEVARSLVGAPQLVAVKAPCLYSAFHCPSGFQPFLRCVISTHLYSPLSLIKSHPYSVE